MHWGGNTDTHEAFMPGNAPELLRGVNRSTKPAWARLVGMEGVQGSQSKETNTRNFTGPWVHSHPRLPLKKGY